MVDQPDLDLSTSRWVRNGDRQKVRERIADGHGSMPAFAKKLSPDELEGLVDYVLELDEVAGAAGDDGGDATPITEAD